MTTKSSQDAYITDEIGTDMVTLSLVCGPAYGEPSQSFTVHKAPLCKKIPYFIELVANAEEGRSTNVVFVNENPVAWKLLIAWVYTNEIKTFPTGENTGSEGLSQAGQILSLALLAEGLEVVNLADNAMDKLNRMWSFKEQPTPIELSEVFRVASSDFRTRRWALRALTEWLSTRQKAYEDENDHSGFNFNKDNIKVVLASNKNMQSDLLDVIQRDGLSWDPSQTDLCHYHQHGLDEECPYTYDDDNGSSDSESDAGSDVESDAEGQREVDVLGQPD